MKLQGKTFGFTYELVLSLVLKTKCEFSFFFLINDQVTNYATK